MREVKFYSKNDYSVGWNLTKIATIYNEFSPDNRFTLNQVLELHNCTKYIDNELLLEKWDEDYKLFLKDTNRIVKGKIARYFAELDEENILNDLKDVQFNYKEDFIELFLRFKLYQKVPEEIVRDWLEQKVFTVYTICHNKQFVNTYNDIVSNLILKDVSNAEIVIETYLKQITNEKEVYLPNIDNESILKLISDYIDFNGVNLNHLNLLINAKSVPGFNITPELKLKAKRKAEKLTEEYFIQGTGMQFEHIVAFQRNLGVPMKDDLNSEKGVFKIEFDKSLLEENLDYYTVIHNFIWLFNYIDSNGRISFVNLKSMASAFMDILGITGKFDYKTNHYFNTKEIFSHLTLNGYYDLLRNLEVEIERVIEWYFIDHLKEEFKIDNYIVELPSKHATYREKCLTLFSEMEYVLSQFDTFVRYKSIDQELIAVNSNGILFSQLSSLINKKYIYAKQSLQNIMFQLFSDQSGLTYIDDNFKGSSFFELINSKEVKMEKFHNYQQHLVQQLIDLNYLIIDKYGVVRWENLNKIFLLNDLYKNEVAIYHRLPQVLQKEVDILIDEGLIEIESTLFSKLEQQYFDYYLNNHQFQNGLQLRNKYMHRRQVLLDERQHKQNYLIGLKLFICIVLKINEEFCLAADEGLLEDVPAYLS
ncbi:hypothetical protein [Lysinibacillus xylanilyticus]|uniref:hypothetical protein n=1 Tax=Lysinibacillus xylanilyticus TaxID=582475 RepID=UPI0036DC4A95